MDTRSPRDIVAELMADLHRHEAEAEEQAAKADPEKHRNSRTMARGCDTSYCYYHGGKTKRRVVWWCYSNHPNVAGFYLSWKQTRTKRYVRRTEFKSWRKQTSAQAWCFKRAGKL